MKFLEFCQYLQKLEGTASRNDMTVILSDLITKLQKSELKAGLLLLQGRIVPQYVNLEFNFATKLLIRTLVNKKYSLGLLNDELLKVGDLGLLFGKYIESDSESLTLNEVYERFLDLAYLSGKDSQLRKINTFKDLISKMSSLEAKYCSRIVIGKLRLGISDKTILDALSWASVGNKSLKVALERAYGAKADLPSLAESLLFEGEKSLENIELEVGAPVSSKLVEREQSLEKIFERFDNGLIVQPKYDGLRMQIHFLKKGFNDLRQGIELVREKEYVRLFSRNMLNITDMFPDVVSEVEKLGVDSIVLDSEVIGIDPVTGEILPFQETIQRKRKYEVKKKSKQIPVRAFCFDILHLNGKSLLNESLEYRLNKLDIVLKKANSEVLTLSESVDIENIDQLKKKFNEYKNHKLEGLIAKDSSSIYEPGSRNFSWIKYKVKAQSGLADNFDTVILGYYGGTGVRAKFGIGAILVGVYDSKSDVFVSLAKVGTGFKDKDWKLIKSRLDDNKAMSLPQNVVINSTLLPDVLVKPEIVCVVEADEISKSKVHGRKGARFSLRFPRFKGLREDKLPNQITTVEEIERIYGL